MEELDLAMGVFLVIFALVFLVLFPGTVNSIIQGISSIPM